MASDVSEIEARSAAQREAPQRQRPVRPHRFRFMLIYGGLVAVLAAAAVGVVVYAGRSINPSPAWSSFKPSGGGLGEAKQIASRVAKDYRLPNGAQLVDVIAKPPSLSDTTTTIPIRILAVRGAKGGVDEVSEVSPTDTVMYSLCGLGRQCAIATGKPSVARGVLVRREILELALYTFKYTGGIKNVIAFMPPASGKRPPTIYLRKSDVEEELKKPLTETLGAKVPQPTTIPPREVHMIDAITRSRVYNFGLSQTQQGDPVLVLTPIITS